MATHVRRITFFMADELPIKKPCSCTCSSEQTCFDQAYSLAQSCTDYTKQVQGVNSVSNPYPRFQLKIVECETALKSMDESKYKTYLAGRVQAWKQKSEHIERLMARAQENRRIDVRVSTDQ